MVAKKTDSGPDFRLTRSRHPSASGRRIGSPAGDGWAARRDPKPNIRVFYDAGLYKDRGGPAQLGTRDWAGLKGHGADRDLALYGGQKRAAPGEGNSHVRWHRALKGRFWVDYNSN